MTTLDPSGPALAGEEGHERLDRLLASVPADPVTAADELARHASAAAGTPVSVCAWRDGRWSVLAGSGIGVAGLPVGGPDTGAADGASGLVHGPDGPAALCWDPDIRPGREVLARLRHGRAWLSLQLQGTRARGEIESVAAETEAVREVSRRLLTVRDLDQVLLTVAEQTLRLLDSDICGVMLREDDVVRMRACVGNRATETARLRMHRGQGVAGLVFLTGEPARVDSYLDDRTISDDFMSLAEREETRSALAVPLQLHGEFLGVLEVWRRRRSVFTDNDVRRMVTLADFATIAIDNARLHDEQTAAAAELGHAHDALQRHVAVVDRASRLQQDLLRTVIGGGGLPAVARAVATELCCEIAVYGPDGERVAGHRSRDLVSQLPAVLPVTTGGNATPTLRNRQVVARPVHADGDQVGQMLIARTGRTDDLVDVVAGQVAMACSLALLRERAAGRARAEAAEQVLWDLLQGPVEHRIAARTRAQQLGVHLTGGLRVLHGRIDDLAAVAAEHGWDTSQTDRVRRRVLRIVRTLHGHGLALASLRGDLIVGIAADLDRKAARELVTAFSAAIHEELPELRLTWGISRERREVVDLPSALNEARTALSAATRFGGQDVFLYEELGIVRLLLGSGDDPDLQTFVDEVTGPLLDYDRDNDGSLVRTLRAFFDADCSQKLAADRLFVHHKTLRYRLERIRQLTGLDLSRHEDRMRADFALRLLQVTRADEDEGPDPV
ncbi:helix-turn-helix domain-containing protein [Pseudonocardia phyllosphaerae]|uniref:helix-turn-helix domain-containing protein n=1 Tax=Pseudonocardia phyllosphaerae TaxID=3390502 RepID=UPI00397B67FB